MRTDEMKTADPRGQRKRAVRVTNGPSLGRKRPRRATTTRAKLAMSHRKSYGCIATFSNANFAELHVRKRRPRRKGSLGQRSKAACRARKKAVRSPNGPSLGRKRPKWAAVSGKVVSPPRIRHMILFAHNSKLTGRVGVQSQGMCSVDATGSVAFITPLQ